MHRRTDLKFNYGKKPAEGTVRVTQYVPSNVTCVIHVKV